MKRIILCILAASLSVAAPSKAQLQDATPQGGFFQQLNYSLSIGLGTGLPLKPDKDFSDDWKGSFGAQLEAMASRSLVGVGITFDYNFMTIENSSDATPEDINILTVFLNVRIKPIEKSAVRPYIIGGGGLYRFWIVNVTNPDRTVTSLYKNAIGYGAGAGIELDLGDNRAIYVEARNIIGRVNTIERDSGQKRPDGSRILVPFVNLKKENIHHVPVRLGVTFVF